MQSWSLESCCSQVTRGRVWCGSGAWALYKISQLEENIIKGGDGSDLIWHCCQFTLGSNLGKYASKKRMVDKQPSWFLLSLSLAHTVTAPSILWGGEWKAIPYASLACFWLSLTLDWLQIVSSSRLGYLPSTALAMTGAGFWLTNCSAGSFIHTNPCADYPQILFCLCCCCCFPWDNFKPTYGFWLSWNWVSSKLTVYADNLSYTHMWLFLYYSCDSKFYTIYTAFLSSGFLQEAWGLTANWFSINWDCFSVIADCVVLKSAPSSSSKLLTELLGSRLLLHIPGKPWKTHSVSQTCWSNLLLPAGFYSCKQSFKIKQINQN